MFSDSKRPVSMFSFSSFFVLLCAPLRFALGFFEETVCSESFGNWERSVKQWSIDSLFRITSSVGEPNFARISSSFTGTIKFLLPVFKSLSDFTSNLISFILVFFPF